MGTNRKVMEGIKVTRHLSFEDIERVHLECLGETEYSTDYTIEGVSSDGSTVSLTREEFKGDIVEQGIWGFVEDGVIHIWYNETATPSVIINFFAHEIGHMVGKPYKDLVKEENRACLFGSVAEMAYEEFVKINTE